jgi:hypothetical protein
MAYDNTIPKPTDKLKDSQADLLANFVAIQTLIEVNHGTFGASDQGQHKFITLPTQSSDPTINAAEIGLFSKNFLAWNNQLRVQRNSGGNLVPFTAVDGGTPGWTFLPSGILLKWGTATGTGLATLTFPTGANIPVFSSVYSVQLTTTNSGITESDTFCRLVDFNATRFRMYCSPRTTATGAAFAACNYLAIGLWDGNE